MAQSLFEAVKTILHITVSGHYDAQINDMIAEAKRELTRSGVSELVATDEENELVRSAIKTYCQMMSTEDPNRRDMFSESFTYQQDCLRKSEGYKREGVNIL